jgi:hypothetical protein
MTKSSSLPKAADSTASADATLQSRPTIDQQSQIDVDLELVQRAARDDAHTREVLTLYQLIKDSIGGVMALDDGYSQRIFARIWPGEAAKPLQQK